MPAESQLGVEHVRNDAEAVVHGAYQALAVGEREAQLAYFADDAIFHQHVPEGTIPHAGLSIGKRQFAERLDYIYANWDILKSEPLSFRVDGDWVHCQMASVFRYKRTGAIFEGRIRHVFHVVDGRIARLDEYVDAPLLRAFLELNDWEAARG